MSWSFGARLIERGLEASWYNGSRRVRDVGGWHLARSGFFRFLHSACTIRIDRNAGKVDIMG